MATPAADLYPWLVADIGGTNARFGLVRDASAQVSDVIALKVAEFATPEDAASRYLDQIGERDGTRPRPGVAAYAAAAAIDGDTFRLTNHTWTISRPAALAALGARHVLLLNDFEALAFALPRLSAADVQPIGAGVPDRKLPMAVIGPGTGLGVGTCVPTPGGSWIAVAAEGGHVSASAADDFEADVLRLVRADFGHVSAERVLSGIGMPNLYRAIVRLRGGQPETLATEAITQRALSGENPDCVATLETFCAMLGGFAGNVALTIGARGGVFIAGGIVPRLGDFFFRSRFRERFEAKGRFTSYLAAIATALITARHPAMTGAAQAIELQLRAAS
jgi:glucokinase